MKKLVKSRKALGMLILGASLVQFSNVGAVPMNITATVAGTCQLGTMGDVVFGVLTPGVGSDGAASGSVQYRCTNGTTAQIAIDDGGNGDRTMDHTVTASTLAYQLYKDSTYTQVWSDSGSDLGVLGTGFAGGFATATVYGQVLSAAIDLAEVGDYSDIVDVTITIVP